MRRISAPPIGGGPAGAQGQRRGSQAEFLQACLDGESARVVCGAAAGAGHRHCRTGWAERMLDRQARKGVSPTTLGADKGYHATACVQDLRDRQIRPIAQVIGRGTPGLDGRTTQHRGYALSQRIRKRVEEIFGWMKTVGGLRKTRFRGLTRTELSRSLSKIRLIYCGCAGFGQIFRSFSLNSHHYSPQTIEKSDSNQHNLVTIANLGQAPRHFVGGLPTCCESVDCTLIWSPPRGNAGTPMRTGPQTSSPSPKRGLKQGALPQDPDNREGNTEKFPTFSTSC